MCKIEIKYAKYYKNTKKFLKIAIIFEKLVYNEAIKIREYDMKKEDFQSLTEKELFEVVGGRMYMLLPDSGGDRSIPGISKGPGIFFFDRG
ncbi:TPA: ComC/BlpC family leader-containing pheromone/bacteriocin [Streptococcus equi subsp. zooepidemicus]|nr:ComC/BlpC family leader-containing pheromone/bacteriocin [Streptococcus equi subsp. zooepidemicus]HEL0004788.1 ComC/BlpC family leader-containing pheromone/bacteriocin [Streptococcus equi subsp. zooepidemicus]HEL1033979.1 ComC/BlpC family leader-containing pheromone/bacteriocin [Streptococcus equi subsp. zooepidemicus]HEL1082433.1 ComC/BlpC family leader-containing pheromone/bacteriocin [Streptococcus equi subsp. zooepidemicus]HEL1164293.1 ComC/BlpC family leader-containing pheromone/bacteri